jgi:cytochrome c-type biogenesis protein CcmH/NrfG
MRLCGSVWLFAAFLAFLKPISANTYPIIVKGTVVMEDGSPPPFTAAVERICSDSSGSAPGPTFNKKGEYVWRMEIDPLATRACFIRATHAGYVSTTIEVQGLDTTKTTIELPPLVLSAAVPDPYSINASENNVPSRSKSAFSAAMKALDTDSAEAGRQLEAAVAASPKFAQGWHALGVVDDRLQKRAEARQAYERAIESDPKLLAAYVTLARLCLKTKDWECATKGADALIKADSKRAYPEIYLHRAVARYELKDLGGAETSVQEALRLDPTRKKPRAEYVLGRILEAKGDAGAAREHMAKYLELEPNASDVEVVRAHLQNIGKPEVAGLEPELEPL